LVAGLVELMVQLTVVWLVIKWVGLKVETMVALKVECLVEKKENNMAVRSVD
jgi:hypothetical protein